MIKNNSFLKSLFCILVVALISFNPESIFAQPPQGEFVPVYATVSAEKVNIRAGQGLNFEVLGQLSRGDEVVVIDEEYGWRKIKLPGQALSFVHKDYLDGNLVKANTLRVRAGAGTNFSILGILKKGEWVNILEEDGNWLKIAAPEGCAGWIKADLLQLSKKKFVPPPPKPFPCEKNIKVSGELKELGKIFRRQGTHKLTEGKKVLYYLKSEEIDLNRYVNNKVDIIGELKNMENSRYPVIKVEQIKKRQWF